MNATRITGVLLLGLTALAASAPAATLAYEYDAATVAGGDTVWSSTVSPPPNSLPTRDWDFGSAIPLAAADPSPATAIDAAVVLDGSTAGGADHFAAVGTTVSIEMWIKPDSLDPAGDGAATTRQQVLIESGGPSGFSLTLWDDTLYGAAKTGLVGDVRKDDPDIILSYQLSGAEVTDFVQAVFTIDTSNGQYALYVNPVGTASPSAAVDSTTSASTSLGGENPAGLGAAGSRVGGSARDDQGTPWYTGDFDTYIGQIGLVRIYDDALTGTEVAASYNTIIPEPATLGMLAVGGAIGLIRRRR